MNLREKALKSLKWTALSSIVGAVSQFLQLVILARLLDPSEFGVMALAMVVIGFSQVFIDMGVSNAIIHDQHISKRQLDSLYWLNVASGALVFVAIFFMAPFLADFYKTDNLTNVIRWISLGFLVQPFEQQFVVLLKKDLKFNQIAKRDVLSKVISFFVSIALAYFGYGVYSLIAANLLAVSFSAILIISIGLQYHRPSFHFRFSEIKALVRFGMFQLGENIVNYFTTQFDTILIGRLLGMEALGIYNVAKNLAMRPSQIINPIVTQIGFPLMAKIQTDVVRLKETYLKISYYLALLNFPIYVFLALFAEPIILVCFGSEWASAIAIFRVLAIYAMVRSTANPVGGLILARGRADLGFYWNICLFILLPICIYIGSQFGLMGSSATQLGLQILLIIPSWYFLINRVSGAQLSEYLGSFTGPLFISLAAGIGSAWVLALPFSVLPIILVGSCVFCVVIILVVRFSYKSLYQEGLQYFLQMRTS